ncbi:MAG TPA: hypothetical protein VG389_06285 [Myxococcota bacterium]|jgi:hypothetical protein|nr:hypothetical protein [Myxococcota bacterium]
MAPVRSAAALAAVAALAAALATAAVPRPAAAAGLMRAYGYTYDQVWSATVRLLRVERGFKVVEKDIETGYIVFEFKDSAKDAKVYRATAELVRDKDGTGRAVVKVKLEIADKPELPHTLLHSRLAEKLRAEYGPPFSGGGDGAPAAPAPKDKDKDKGKDKDDPGDKD